MLRGVPRHVGQLDSEMRTPASGQRRAGGAEPLDTRVAAPDLQAVSHPILEMGRLRHKQLAHWLESGRPRA